MQCPQNALNWVLSLQALITGSFSMVYQSMAMGCFPRFRVHHTSEDVGGQVYIPEVSPDRVQECTAQCWWCELWVVHTRMQHLSAEVLSSSLVECERIYLYLYHHSSFKAVRRCLQKLVHLLAAPCNTCPRRTYCKHSFTFCLLFVTTNSLRCKLRVCTGRVPRKGLFVIVQVTGLTCDPLLETSLCNTSSRGGMFW